MIVGVDILFLFESYRFDLCCDTSCVFGNWVSETMVWIIFPYDRAGIYTLRVGSGSGVYTLKIWLTKMAFSSYALSDRHCVMTKTSPAYLDKLLLASGIISGISGLFNVVVVFPLLAILTIECLFHVFPQGRRIVGDHTHDTTIRDTRPTWGP